MFQRNYVSRFTIYVLVCLLIFFLGCGGKAGMNGKGGIISPEKDPGEREPGGNGSTQEPEKKNPTPSPPPDPTNGKESEAPTDGQLEEGVNGQIGIGNDSP